MGKSFELNGEVRKERIADFNSFISYVEETVTEEGAVEDVKLVETRLSDIGALVEIVKRGRYLDGDLGRIFFVEKMCHYFPDSYVISDYDEVEEKQLLADGYEFV